MDKKIKVLYIAGPSRSGSTVLSNLLGEVDGFFNAGELIDIWDMGLGPDGNCGCGHHISECEIWQPILDRTMNQIDIQQMIRLRNKAAHSRKMLLYLMGANKGRLQSRLQAYNEALMALYIAIREVTGCQVIIDPSKNAGYAYILSMLPGIDFYLLHLIRDPRATAYSWLREKDGMRPRSEKPVRSVLQWIMRNIVTEAIGRKIPDRYLRVRYEDFVKMPVEMSELILHFLETPYLDLPFVSSHEVRFGVNHTVYGNPNRNRKGLVKIESDDEWQKMKKSDKFIIFTLTWPFLIRYSYPMVVKPLFRRGISTNKPTPEI